MKYWRGYLTAAVFGAFTYALMLFAKGHAVLIDMVYPYVTRMIQSFLADWSGNAAFCVWQLIALVLAVGVLASIVLMIVLRWNPIQWLGWILAVASLVFMLHTGIYGLNTYAGDLADDVHLEIKEYTVKELEEATAYYRDKANALASTIHRDQNGNPVYPAFAVQAELVGEGFKTLTYDASYPVFAGSLRPVKELGWSNMYTSMGITGFTMPLTGEAAVNPQIPVVSMPFTMCHEMAHRMCIAKERDANFAAFLACSVNTAAEVQYSAYFMAYRYCYNALASVNTDLGAAAAARVSQGVGEKLQHDMSAYRDFFASNRDDKATQLADKANDTYIKVSGDETGIASYGDVCDLLVSWYWQEIVAPTQTEEEVKFDPYDENQVDLTGIVNGPLPEAG